MKATFHNGREEGKEKTVIHAWNTLQVASYMVFNYCSTVDIHVVHIKSKVCLATRLIYIAAVCFHSADTDYFSSL